MSCLSDLTVYESSCDFPGFHHYFPFFLAKDRNPMVVQVRQAPWELVLLINCIKLSGPNNLTRIKGT